MTNTYADAAYRFCHYMGKLVAMRHMYPTMTARDFGAFADLLRNARHIERQAFWAGVQAYRA